MKFSAALVVALTQVASAHYWFDANVINGQAQAPYKYVRRLTRQTPYNPIKFSSNPAADIRDGSFVDGPDIVCNQGAQRTGMQSEVLTVTAGSEVRVRLANPPIIHPGKLSAPRCVSPRANPLMLRPPRPYPGLHVQGSR
jgi:hypothetical protein